MAGVSEFVFEAMVRGYHVYREIWTAAVGEELSCVRETGNYRDPFAVAVTSELAAAIDDHAIFSERGPRRSGRLLGASLAVRKYRYSAMVSSMVNQR